MFLETGFLIIPCFLTLAVNPDTTSQEPKWRLIPNECLPLPLNIEFGINVHKFVLSSENIRKHQIASTSVAIS